MPLKNILYKYIIKSYCEIFFLQVGNYAPYQRIIMFNIEKLIENLCGFGSYGL